MLVLQSLKQNRFFVSVLLSVLCLVTASLGDCATQSLEEADAKTRVLLERIKRNSPQARAERALAALLDVNSCYFKYVNGSESEKKKIDLKCVDEYLENVLKDLRRDVHPVARTKNLPYYEGLMLTAQIWTQLADVRYNRHGCGDKYPDFKMCKRVSYAYETAQEVYVAAMTAASKIYESQSESFIPLKLAVEETITKGLKQTEKYK